VPDLDDAINSADEGLASAELFISLGIRKAVGTTTIDLETFILQMRSQGASSQTIKNLLLQDLETGGRIFGAFKNQFKATADYSVGSMANVGSVFEMQTSGVKDFYWQTSGNNICDDCLDRSGMTESYEYWKLAGLPKSGFSVCGSYCNCDLVPVGKGGDPIKSTTQARG